MGWGSRRYARIFRGAEDLKAYVLTQIDRSKVTRDIVLVDDLPRTALGKVQHFVLRQLHEWAPALGEAI